MWKALTSSDRVFGIALARSLAASVLTATSRSPDGWAKGLHRVAARRVWAMTPELLKLPERWWQVDPVVCAERLGLWWQLDLRDNLQRVLYFTGSYEPQVMATLRRHLTSGSVFVDVGAHVGVHSLAVAKHLERLGGGRVIAFEPTRDSAARIAAGAAANGLEIAVERLALGRGRGEIALYDDPDYDAADAGVRSSSGRGRRVATVPVVAFEDWARDAALDRLDALKIDVEGDELGVIEGMRESIARHEPRVVVVELKERVLSRAGGDARAVRSLLAALGYRSVGVARFSNVVFERA